MTTRFSTAERRNWGYWDGIHARHRGRFPEWNKVSTYRCRHPFDKPYGEGFWSGWYGEDHPNGENAVTRQTREWLISRNEWPHAA
jgi:hypothetical protein